jgi:VanZ family protein
MSNRYAGAVEYSETAWRRFKPQTALQWLSVWWPGAVNVGIVCAESTDHFSAANTRHRYYHWFCDHFGYVSWETWSTINFEIRKAGHFVGYGVMCLIFYTCVARTLLRHVGESANRLRRRRAVGALVCTFLLASGDEIHQSFIPSRTGAFHDVLLDVAGGFVMLMLWFGLQTFLRPDAD